MKVTLLGTSCGVPTAERGLSCAAVRRERELILFDCGEGTQRQMMAFGLSFMRIGSVYVTHFHGDHYLGLFGLVQSMSFFGREDPLDLYGPPGTTDLARLVSHIGNFRSGFEVRARDLDSGDSLQRDGYVVECKAVDHVVPTLGYALVENQRPGRFDVEKARSLGIPEGRLYKELQQGRSIKVAGGEICPEDVIGPPRRGRKVVYMGDVVPGDGAVALSKGADLLVTEATFCDDLAERAAETGHSTVRDACRLARDAGVRRLLLTHFSPRYGLDEIQAEVDFPRTVIGRDGLTLEVRYD
jgi:ribonuclease Z